MNDQLIQSAQVLVTVGNELPTLAAQCHHVYLATRSDGFPSSSMSEGGASNVVHDFVETCPSCQGKKVPCRQCGGTGQVSVRLTVPQHGDPVGELVCNPSSENPARAALRKASSLVREAERLAEKARAELLKAITPPADEPVEDDGLEWCSVCIRVTRKDSQGRMSKVMSPTLTVEAIWPGEPARARCSDCAGWAHMALREGLTQRERPRQLIELRADGRPVTTRDVERALGKSA